MESERIHRKINKLIDEVSGYVYRVEHEFEMPLDEERVAIMSALGGMAIAVGRLCTPEQRKFAERLSMGVAHSIAEKRSGSAHIAPPGGHRILQ